MDIVETRCWIASASMSVLSCAAAFPIVGATHFSPTTTSPLACVPAKRGHLSLTSLGERVAESLARIGVFGGCWVLIGSVEDREGDEEEEVGSRLRVGIGVDPGLRRIGFVFGLRIDPWLTRGEE